VLSEQLVRADLVVTSGGISKGDHDVVKETLSALGTVDFVEVAMQPGKPQGFGRVFDEQTPIITLPGNAVSAYVSFEVFVLPAIRTLMGRTPVSRPLVEARLTEGVRSPAGRRQFLRGRLGAEADSAVVAPVGGAGSHLIGSLAEADCLIVVPEAVTSVEAGERVQVLPLDTEF
jgi:molybdopterin molybdotransferase